MKKIRIYISSTTKDFGRVKQRLVHELNDYTFFDVYETPKEASPDNVVHRCLKDVEECDVYVGIFGHCYGWVPNDEERNPHNQSMTELEYRKAEEIGKKKLIFLCELSGYDASHMEQDELKQRKVNRLRRELEESNEFSAETFLYRNKHDLVGTILKRVLAAEAVAEANIRTYDEYVPPYPGLYSFSYEDRKFYFGREHEISRAMGILDERDCNFFMVCGPSGSGKSSLVEAGLLPALNPTSNNEEQPTWFATTRPAAHPSNPLTALAYKISDRLPGRPLPDQLSEKWTNDPNSFVTDLASLRLPIQVLVIDQLEELFTNFEDIGVRQAFVSAVAHASKSENPNTGKPLTVLASVRSDYKEACQSIPELKEVLSRTHYIDLFELDSVSVRKMIRSPADLANLNVDEVIDSLVAETSSNNGSLPLLATTLRTLWQRKEGNSLKKSTLQILGGISGVISEHANNAYRDFEKKFGPDEANRSFHALFSALVRVNLDGLPVRRVASENEFRRSSAMKLAEKFADEKTRLIYFSDSADSKGRSVEVVHEAIFSSWTPLSDWVNSRKKQEQDLARSRVSADDWLKNQKDISRIDLVNMHDAHRAMRLLDKEPSQLDETTREYLFPKEYLVSRLSETLDGTSVSDRARIGTLLDQIDREWLGVGDDRAGVGVDQFGIPNGDAQYWVSVKPGEIQMEISPTRKERLIIPKEFEVAKYPITQKQFKAFLNSKSGYYNEENWPDLDYIPDPFPFPEYGDNRPVANVAWIEAKAYCIWLTREMHSVGQLDREKVVRLLTEQEWQLASEASMGTGKGDYQKTWDYLSAEFGLMAVGLGPKQENSLASHLDFSSCIWEWCLNQYENYHNIEFDYEKTERAVRGGSFLIGKVKSRERFRGSLHVFGRDVNIGFRVCIARG